MRRGTFELGCYSNVGVPTEDYHAQCFTTHFDARNFAAWEIKRYEEASPIRYATGFWLLSDTDADNTEIHIRSIEEDEGLTYYCYLFDEFGNHAKPQPADPTQGTPIVGTLRPKQTGVVFVRQGLAASGHDTLSGLPPSPLAARRYILEPGKIPTLDTWRPSGRWSAKRLGREGEILRLEAP